MAIKLKIKKNDLVRVLCGRDKGRQGEIISVNPKLNKILVKGINKVTKHVKPNSRTNQPGSIIQKETLIDISNVALVERATVSKKLVNKTKKQPKIDSTNQIIDI